MSNVKRDQMIERASFAGKRAAEQGKTVRDNPFMENTLYWLCWKDGFIDAQKEEIKFIEEVRDESL
jgi:hypothetical protein